MKKPLVSHLDPNFWDRLPILAEMIAAYYGRQDGVSMTLSMSGMSGMEAGLLNLVAPGETVIAASGGFFGNRIQEMVRRRGANLVALDAPFGRHVPNDEILAALEQHPEAVMVCVVYAETSTGVAHPLQQLGEAMRALGSDALLFADCVTAIGAMPIEADAWGVDYAYGCSQKALAAPPGLSPITISNRAIERLGRNGMPVPYSMDIAELIKYWVDRPMTYHHTTPNLGYYALDEALRLGLEEGLQNRFDRHADAGAYIQAGFRERGFDLRPACSMSSTSKSVAASAPPLPRSGASACWASMPTAKPRIASSPPSTRSFPPERISDGCRAAPGSAQRTARDRPRDRLRRSECGSPSRRLRCRGHQGGARRRR
jgi:alanine-glyoxylate transaminase/serine-glyoxylate transaminase/serine-pyruvate transaminase